MVSIADETFPLARGTLRLFKSFSECGGLGFFLVVQKKPEQDHIGRRHSRHSFSACNRCKETGSVCSLPD